MKTCTFFAAVLLFAGAGSLQAQSTSQPNAPDSIHLRIVENKNGNLLLIDTVVPVSQQQNLMVWLSTQGVELPPPPPAPMGDSLVFEKQIIILDDSMIMNGSEMPLPPPVPEFIPAPGTRGEMRVIVMPPPPPGEPGIPPVPPVMLWKTEGGPDSAMQCRKICVMMLDSAMTPGQQMRVVMFDTLMPPGAPPMPPCPPKGATYIRTCPPPPPGAKGECTTVIIRRDSTGKETKQVIVYGHGDGAQPPAPPTPPKQGASKTAAPRENGLTVFPNPTTGRVTLSFELPGKAKTNIRITDMNGKVVYEEQLGESFTGRYSKEIDLGSEKGMYTIEVRKGDEVLVKKVVLQ